MGRVVSSNQYTPLTLLGEFIYFACTTYAGFSIVILGFPKVGHKVALSNLTARVACLGGKLLRVFLGMPIRILPVPGELSTSANSAVRPSDTCLL